MGNKPKKTTKPNPTPDIQTEITPETSTDNSNNAKSMLENKPKKTTKPTSNTIYTCKTCDYKSRNPKALCPRHFTSLIPWT